jgi:prepilin-type N-terminal cleavage/methylation domain-containing protein
MIKIYKTLLKRSPGFTLVELIVAISVMSVLSE